MQDIPRIDSYDLTEMLRDNEPVFVLDVRTEQELGQAKMAQAHHIPLDALPQRLAEIPRDILVVCMCHHGMRSKRAAEYLIEQGFTAVKSLDGGIHGMALLDKSIARY